MDGAVATKRRMGETAMRRQPWRANKDKNQNREWTRIDANEKLKLTTETQRLSDFFL
jgi:hypothetical protein